MEFSPFASPLPARSLEGERFDPSRSRERAGCPEVRLPVLAPSDRGVREGGVDGRFSVVRASRTLESGRTSPRPSAERCRAAGIVDRSGFEAARQAPSRLVSSDEVGA